MVTANHRRLTGTALGLTINEVDYWADISKWELAPSDGDKETLTFGDAASGATSSWVLKGSAIVSFETGSFWDMVWANAGKVVNFILSPHGNRLAKDGKPHFSGRVKIGSKPSLSSEAGETKGATFDFEWTCIGEPTMSTSSSTMGTGAMEDATS